jgi:hypothetical protein
MPQQPEKKNLVNVEPTPGLMERLFGSNRLSPEQQQGLDMARKYNPNIQADTVKPYGFVSKLMQPNAIGYTSPGQGIYLNQGQQGQSANDWASTIIHEQTHADQMKNRGYGPTREFLHEMFGGNSPYHRRPDEMEAFQREKDFNNSRRMQSVVPNFETGQFYVPMDKNLPVDTGPTSSTLRRYIR